MERGGGEGSRSLEETPTWAVALVCFVLVVISIIIEHSLHLLAKLLTKHHKRALVEALEKVKSELMLMGFISLLLTVGQGQISKICVPKSVGNSWHPCNKEEENNYTDFDEDALSDKCASKNQVPLISSEGIHQLHIFIFVLAVTHVLYSITTMALGGLKMRRWKNWEEETTTAEYRFAHDPDRFRLARDTSFGRRHLSYWSTSPVLIWIACFFRQFLRSISKVDYFTLRHGFIMAHLAPHSTTKFNFQNYIKRSLENDFKAVVGVSPIIWFSAVVVLLFNTHGWNSYLWMPFIPLVIILLIGTKLQVIITKMALQIMDRGDVVKGVPVVHPKDDLFWFNRPTLILFLIQFVLFQNAFQIAFLAWSLYEFGYPSCFHKNVEDMVIRITMGVLIQVLCSYVTLPLYALVTQMGSNMKPAIFNEKIADALRKWHHTAKKRLKESRKSGSNTPLSTSRPATPVHGFSPVHLLRYYRSELDSAQTSPTKRYNADDEHFDLDSSPSTSNQNTLGSEAQHLRLTLQQIIERAESVDTTTHWQSNDDIHIEMGTNEIRDFSFERRLEQ
ncbi:mlo protein [Dioscorea alata]|uniref:Mlo protein n=1 Tax=Dioscorea alata TaxID=55571 RepID=A0ACB7UQU7_DIOAL|nr:mlo protein [Dioscorea alata]